VRHVLGIVMLAAFNVAGSPLVAAADPVVITSGTIFAPHPFNQSARFDISGDTFSLSGLLSEGGAGICFPCRPGTHQFARFWGGDMGTGLGTVNGTSYSRLYWAGTGFVVGGSATLPEDAPPTFSVMFPFTAQGAIWGLVDPHFGAPVFMLDVTGSGTATMTVNTGPDLSGPLYSIGALSFAFADPTVPAVPEPTSFVLLGTALAGAVARRAWQSRKAR
jgi:hypothetical protein